MAHTCPECYQQCHCNGDIDDLLLDTEEAYLKCDHCPLYGIEEDDFSCAEEYEHWKASQEE